MFRWLTPPANFQRASGSQPRRQGRQAKGGKDRLSVVQIGQDMALAAERFSGLICRPIGAQFMTDGAIALFEFTEGDDGIAIRQEVHYRLVPPDELTPEDLARYRGTAQA